MRRTVKRVALGVALLVALGAAGLVCTRVADRGRYASEYSTYGAGPEGTRALYLLADELGAHPRRWAEELGRLPEDGGMLVALGSCEQLMRREVNRIERERLREWVERGGVLVVAGVPSYLSRADFGAELVSDPDACRPTHGLLGMLARAEQRAAGEDAPRTEDDTDRPTELEELPRAFGEDPAGTYEEVTARDELPPPRAALATGEPLVGAGLVELRRPLGIALDDGLAAHTLLTLDDATERPVGVRIEVGRGAVVLLSSASLFTNRDLVAGGGAVVFARLVREHAPEGPVLFDEYHLGVGQRRSTMRYLRQAGATGIVVQVLVLIGLVLWRVGARFGGVRSDPPPEPGGTLSYVDGVAQLYSKARDPEGAARIVTRRGIARIAAHHHLATTDPTRMAELLEQRGQARVADAVRALAGMLEGDAPRGLTATIAAVDQHVAAAERDANALDSHGEAR